MAVGVEIEFFKVAGTRYRSVLSRADGVLVELDGGGWNKIGDPEGKVPHDIAHLVTEDVLGLKRGLWGVLAAGGIVQNARVIEGRQPPHSASRAEAVVAPARECLRQAEVVVRAVADLSLAGTPGDLAAFNRAVGDRWRVDNVTAEKLVKASVDMARCAVQWADLPEGGSWRALSPSY